MTEPGDGFFKVEDFLDESRFPMVRVERVVEVANRLLRERGRVVYRHRGQMFKEMWGEHPGIEGWEKGVVDAALLIDARKVDEDA